MFVDDKNSQEAHKFNMLSACYWDQIDTHI